MAALKISIFTGLLILLLTACGITLRPAQERPSITLPNIQSVTPDGTIVSAPQDSPDILDWTLRDGADCKGLVINAYHEMLINDCEGNTITSQPEPLLFKEMVNRFESFTYNSDKSKLIFNGKGVVSGEVWQGAIDRWVESTYAQETTGHVCASCQTILAWNLGNAQDTPELCKLLVVLDYGYAYAQKITCAGGGQSTGTAQAWLDTTEWTILNSWFTNHLYTTQPEGYFSSSENGGQTMSPDEIAKLNGLANSIYNRITQNSNQ